MVLTVTISLRCDRGCGDGRGCDLESHRREVTVSGDVDADSLYSMTAPETLTPREESAAMAALWDAQDASRDWNRRDGADRLHAALVLEAQRTADRRRPGPAQGARGSGRTVRRAVSGQFQRADRRSPRR